MNNYKGLYFRVDQYKKERLYKLGPAHKDYRDCVQCLWGPGTNLWFLSGIFHKNGWLAYATISEYKHEQKIAKIFNHLEYGPDIIFVEKIQ